MPGYPPVLNYHDDMLPAEKLELAIYKHIKAAEPLVATVSLPFLSQVVGESNHGRIVDCLKYLEAEKPDTDHKV